MIISRFITPIYQSAFPALVSRPSSANIDRKKVYQCQNISQLFAVQQLKQFIRLRETLILHIDLLFFIFFFVVINLPNVKD